MSRELYRGRSKKVQKLGRDGLVEQDRATGQERRVSQRAADVSFGPERREPERAAPPSQQREHQRRQYQQEVRQTENPAAVSGWEPVREPSAPDMSAGCGYSSDSFSADASVADNGAFDASVPDAYAPDLTAPDQTDAAPSMRGAADMPMMDTPSAVDSGPILVHLRGKRPDSGKKPDSERNPNRQGKGGGQFRQGPGAREAAKADAESRIPEKRSAEGRSAERRNAETEIPHNDTPKRQDGENRRHLKSDGEKRLPLREAHREGDSASSSLRGAVDKPLTDRHADRLPVRDNPPKYRHEPSGRLQFGGEREGKPDSRQDVRQDGRRRLVRQFAVGAEKDKPDRLHYEAVRPATFDSSGAVPKGPRLRVVPEKEPLSDVPEDEEQQTETDAVEAALYAAIPLRNAADALRPPSKGKERNGNRLRFNKGRDDEQEDRAPGDRRQESGETVKRRRGEQFRTESGGAEGSRHPFVEPVDPETDWTPDAVDKGPEIARDFTITADFTTEDPSGAVLEPEEPSESGGAEGRLRHDRRKLPDHTTSPRLKNDRQKPEHREDWRTPREDRQRTRFSADAASTERRPRFGRKQKETAEKVDWTPVDFRSTEEESQWVQPDMDAADMDAVPLYAEIDGQFVPEEIIVEPAETERKFQRNRTSRRGTNYRNYSETQDRQNRADSAYTVENEPCSVVIEAEYTIVETPETAPDNLSGESAENCGEPSGKEAENRPLVQRMEDGARVRCDADWDNDSGSKNGKSKAENTGESSLNSETKEAGKGRLRFGKDTSRVTDDSQITRKKKRLFFGIGKKAVFPDSAESRGQEQQKPEKAGPVQSESVQPEPVESVQPEPVTGAKNPAKPESTTASKKRVSARIKQRREARERGQGRPAENSPRRVPVPPAVNRPPAMPPAAKERKGPQERTQTGGEPERRAAPEDGELWTRTRRGAYGTRTADGAKDRQDRHRSGADGANQQGQRRRQRLHFEAEPLAPAPQPGDEGYTRSPPRRTEDSDGLEPDKPARKPRLRFEDEQPDNSPDDAPDNAPEKQGRPGSENGQTNSGQTEGEQADGDEGETSADGAVPPPADRNSGDALSEEANHGDGGGNHPGGNAAQKKPPTREDIQVSKAEKRVDRASRKLEKARSKLPAKRRIKLTKNYDETPGKVKHRLQFEKEYLPEGASAVPLPLRGIDGAANSARVTALLKGHQKIREVERDNVGVESAHKVELFAEQGAAGILRWNHNRLRSRPYRAVRQAERALEREQVNLEWRRTLRDHPELQRKHALAKWTQKQRIKRKYAAAAREAKKTQQHTQTVLNETGQIIRSTIKQIIAKKSILATVALLALIVLLFSAGLTSCMAMLSSSQSSYISVSYMADEEDITEADLYYSEMETDLQIDIDDTEINHPGYDEYRYNVGQIAHSPFELLAYLSTKYNAFKFSAIKSYIEALFWQQYTLTRTVVVETRSDGEGGSYPWYVLVTTLTVRPLSSIASGTLDAGEETTRYGLYMQTYGDRQAFGNPFDFAWLGRVSSLYGYRKHPMTGAKNLHRGIDIGAPEGTEIRAIQDGRVVTAGEHESYGLYVVIEGEKGYSTLYAHCSSLNVHAGQRVKRGDVIAVVGSTGDSTGPHLHLETKLDGEYLNPIFFVETGGSGGGAVPGGGVVIPDYPGEAPTDETFARMLEEAEKYLGYPYVWGGSNPSTSFDCSGFVSWVINHSGWNVGRLGAQGLCNLCTPVSPAEAKPGDLVFFRYTYNAPIPDGATHVGIYVGNNTMIHCGNPISYASLNTSYWQSHFYLFGRLPTP